MELFLLIYPFHFKTTEARWFFLFEFIHIYSVICWFSYRVTETFAVFVWGFSEYEQIIKTKAFTVWKVMNLHKLAYLQYELAQSHRKVGEKKEKKVLIEMIQKFWLKHSCKCFFGHVPGHLVVLSPVTLQWCRSLRLLTQIHAPVYCGDLSWYRNEDWISIIRKFGENSKQE